MVNSENSPDDERHRPRIRPRTLPGTVARRVRPNGKRPRIRGARRQQGRESPQVRGPPESAENDESDDDAPTCPVCGQEYDHKRTENRMNSANLRRDATECKAPEIVHNERTVYVHVQ